MKILISFIISVTLVIFIAAVLSYFFTMRDNRQVLEVYVDRNGQIFLNGVQSTENRATQLMNDPRYKASISYHSESSVHYCFGQYL